MSAGASGGPAGFRRRLLAGGEARAGLALVLLLLLVALLAGVLAPGDPSRMGPAGEALRPPSAAHPLGTDPLGRDVLARVIHGSRISLVVGWSAVLAAVMIGTAVGMAAGLGPAFLDRLLMGTVDLFLAFPRVFLFLLLVVLMRPSTALVIVVLGLSRWMGIARLVRAEVLLLREREFVAAARGLGLGPWRLAWRHVLPHVAPTVIVAGALRLGGAILAEAFLSFLGLGVQEPSVSWGAMIEQGRAHLLDGWWLVTFPGLAVTLTVIGYNLLGDGLRAALDPRAAKEGGVDRYRTAGG